MASPNNTANAQPLNWHNEIDADSELPEIDWAALEEYAIDIKRKYTDHDGEITCQLSAEYNKGGVHVVRRLDFNDGTSWLARLQMHGTGEESSQNLISEVHTIEVLRERSKVPVPKVFAYDASYDNVIGAPLMIMEYIPADTAMDSFGGYDAHRGTTPPQFKEKYHTQMAEIQVEMSSVRFPKIGSIIQLPDGTYSVGPMPGLGGPFDSAADFFKAFAKYATFPTSEETIRKYTPPELVEEVLKSINDFPSKLENFAQHYRFQEGPFPIFHNDLYKSNVLVDSEYNVQAVIDWDGAIVVPWEAVEFIDELTLLPPAMMASYYKEEDLDRQNAAECRKYVEVVKKTEKARQFDGKLSTVLGDQKIQSLAQGIWLHQKAGKIGFYSSILELFELEE